MGPYCERKVLFVLDLVRREPSDVIRFFGLFLALVYLNSEALISLYFLFLGLFI